MQSKNNKQKEGLRNIKKNFIKDTELEPSLKYEISKESDVKTKKNNLK